MKKEERQAKLLAKLEEMKRYETSLYREGCKYIAGVDEVGRGPLAGPVVAACVVLPEDFNIPGIDDSKKLSPKKREEFYDIIKGSAIAYKIAVVDNARIDEINILEATKEAMGMAILETDGELRTMEHRELGESQGGIDCVLIDAVFLKNIGDIRQIPIIKGDSKSISIAAASIIAKVTRDRMMEEYAIKYADYAFEKNKGYGTKAHYEGLEQAGICPIHRRSFLKNFLNQKK